MLLCAPLVVPMSAANAGSSSVQDSDARVEVTASSPTTLEFPVMRSGGDDGYPVWLPYQTQDGSAVAGRDYTAASGRLKLAPGGNAARIPVPSVSMQAPFAVDAMPYDEPPTELGNDGKPDLINVNYSAGTISVRLNEAPPGAATVALGSERGPSSACAHCVTAADVNDDSIKTSSPATESIYVRRGKLARRGGPGGGSIGAWGLLYLAGLLTLRLMSRRCLGALLAAALLLPIGAAADSGPWYVAGQLNSLVAPGRDVSPDGATGWTLLGGRRINKHFSGELSYSYYGDDPRSLKATANWEHIGLRGLWYPWANDDGFAPFALAGVGHQYEFRGDDSETSANTLSFGAGFVSQPWDSPVAIRVELEVQHGMGGFTDRIVSGGLLVPFGGQSGAQAPQSRPTPVPPASRPPAPEPAPEPPADTDKDGVPDSADQCPGSPADAKVDATGCQLHRVIRLQNVHFKTDSSELTDSDQTTLADAAKTLARYPALKAEVAGYTDNLGPSDYNRNLSAERAATVKAYLVDHGIAAERLSTRGYGASQPIESNDTAEGRNANRRVELHIRNLDVLDVPTDVRHR